MEFTYESVSTIVISAIFLTIGFIIIYFLTFEKEPPKGHSSGQLLQVWKTFAVDLHKIRNRIRLYIAGIFRVLCFHQYRLHRFYSV